MAQLAKNAKWKEGFMSGMLKRMAAFDWIPCVWGGKHETERCDYREWQRKPTKIPKTLL